MVRRRQERHVVAARDLRRRIGGPVVHHDHLEVRIVDPLQTVERVADRGGAVVAAHHDGDARAIGSRARRHVRVGPLHRGQGRLRPAVAGREAEVPVQHVEPALVPLRRPAEDEAPGAAGLEGLAHLPVEHFRLAQLAVAQAVDADLGQDERALAHQVLQARQVRRKIRPRLEVDVERREVEERELEVLRAWIAHVRDEPFRVLRLHLRAKIRQEALDATPAVPAHQRRRDLVADRVAEQRRVTRERARALAHLRLDAARRTAALQERHVLRPVEPRHDAQTPLLREIQQPERRPRVDAHGVDAARGHRFEVARHHVGLRHPIPVAVAAEGAVGDAAHPELLSAHLEELAARDRALPCLQHADRGLRDTKRDVRREGSRQAIHDRPRQGARRDGRDQSAPPRATPRTLPTSCPPSLSASASTSTSTSTSASTAPPRPAPPAIREPHRRAPGGIPVVAPGPIRTEAFEPDQPSESTKICNRFATRASQSRQAYTRERRKPGTCGHCARSAGW